MKGHIRERSPGRWAIVLDVRDPVAGDRKRRWHSFAGTKRQAQIECARLVAELQNGIAIEPRKVKLGEFLDRWLEYIRPNVAPKTFERYSEIVQKSLVPMLGNIVLAKLQPIQISTAYVTALTKGRRDGRGGLAPRTVHHLHRILKQGLAQAVRWQMLARNPADAVDPPKVERASMTTYDLEQTGQLIEALRGTRLFIPVLLAVLCGLRRGEIAALRWRSVNPETAQLTVAESVEQMKGTVRLKLPKSGRARTVALSPTMVEELRGHRLQQAQGLLRLGVRLSQESFVCALEDGRMLQPTFITHEWLRLVRRTGLPVYRFHDLRHAHATHLLAAGVHPKVASERLGHSKIGITLDLYSHVMPGMQEDAAARVDLALRTAMANPSRQKW
jgi:integrase